MSFEDVRVRKKLRSVVALPLLYMMISGLMQSYRGLKLTAIRGFPAHVRIVVKKRPEANTKLTVKKNLKKITA